MKNYLAMLAALALTGCGSMLQLSPPSPVTEKLVKVPELNTTASATVGSTIYKQARYWSKTGYRLVDPVVTTLALNTVRANAGSFLVPATFDGSSGYCTEQLALSDLLVGPLARACFVDSNKSGSFDTLKGAPGMYWFQKRLEPAARYETSELAIERDDAIKSELIYQGYSNKSIKLSYREYIRDMARPSYFQDVTYDVQEFPTTVSFRSVRLNILGADSNGLRYQVLSGF